MGSAPEPFPWCSCQLDVSSVIGQLGKHSFSFRGCSCVCNTGRCVFSSGASSRVDLHWLLNWILQLQTERSQLVPHQVISWLFSLMSRLVRGIPLSKIASCLPSLPLTFKISQPDNFFFVCHLICPLLLQWYNDYQSGKNLLTDGDRRD